MNFETGGNSNCSERFNKILMDTSFERVKSIIERLREVLKCKKCSQMKEENSMLFYHICDHFYCLDCLNDDKICPLCQNFFDKPTNVSSDKNILSLYQSLAKFELPSKQDIQKIYESHKVTKEESTKKSPTQELHKQNEIQETPKNQTKSKRNLREREKKKNGLTSPGTMKTVLVSSEESCITITSEAANVAGENPSTSGKKSNSTSSKRWKNIVADVTSCEKISTILATPSGKKQSTNLTNSTGSFKESTPFTKNNINKRNPKGETKLHLACKKSDFTLMTELIAAGANPNAQDNAGWTPLHESVFSGNVEVIKFLLDNGAKVNAPGLENTTALHEAIAKGNVTLVKMLLEYGADVNAMNIFKETPLDLVTKYKFEEMKEVLSGATNNSKKTSVEIEEPDEKLLCKYNLSAKDEKLFNKFADKFNLEITSSLTWKKPPSHIVVPDEKVEMTWDLISSVPSGCWVVTMDWVKDSLNENEPKPSRDYELSAESFSGFSKARGNKLNQLPGLFSGCHFFFGGFFECYTIKNLTVAKEDLKNLVKSNGGAIVRRCPNPESLSLEKTIPFHASPDSSLRETSYFIIYQTEKWDPKPKYNMSHMKTLPVEWLLHCLLKFELTDPSDKMLWSDFM